jgi:hypothetical protein
MNPNDAQLVRIYTQKSNGGQPTGPDLTPIGGTAGNVADFEVVVEGEAGRVLGNSGAPYRLTVSAIDLTDVNNPNSAANVFSHTFSEAWTTALWLSPNYRKVIRVRLNNVAAVKGDMLRYMAVLNAQNEVDSSVESPVFTLTQ